VIQIRFVKLRCEAARLKHAVLFALLLGACLLAASFQTRSEAFEGETPAATSAEDGDDVEVGNKGPMRDPLSDLKEPVIKSSADGDSSELRPSSTEVSSTPDANGDTVITKVYRLKNGRAVNLGNTLSNMFNMRKMPAEVINLVDERTNSLIARTTPQRHEEIERLLKILDVPVEDDAAAESTSNKSRNKILRDQSQAEIALEKQIHELSAKLKQLAETVDGQPSQDPASGDDQAAQLATQLKDAVEKSFNERQRQQLAEIERLTSRLKRLAKSVRQREAEREQIISRKIDELLGKSSTKTSTTESAPFDLDAVTALPMTIKYFHVPWTESCRKMMQEIEALQREGFPVVVINMNEENNASNPWQIAGVPAVLIEVLQKEVFRNVGFMDRNALREQVRKIMEKQSRLTISSEWRPPENPNPGEILKEAKADTAAQRYPVALSKYVWYFENALKYDPAQTGVRLSFALGYWRELAASYPPALDALKLLRDEAEQRFDDGARTVHAVMEIAALNRVLNDDERTRLMFEAVAESDPATAKFVFAFVRPSLVKAKAYTLCGKFLDPQQDLERIRKHRQLMIQVYREAGKDPHIDMNAISTQMFVEEVATLVALLVLNDRKQDAENIATTAKSEITDTSLHTIIDAALTGTLPD
jgi:thiol-disulfide isomerase/thioredoxin